MIRTFKFIVLTSLWILTSVAAIPVSADDITISLDAGSKFTVDRLSDGTGLITIDEATGNVDLFNTLFIHTTAGSSNTFVGRGAGNTGVTGFNLTAVGQNALSANTSGVRNTAFGTGAMRFNENGDHNTAYGERAMTSNVNGANNTGLGMEALILNVDGSLNTAVGKSALYANLSGSRNTAAGYNSLRNSTGSGNTGIGYEAGLDQVTGNDDIYIAHPGVEGESGVIRIGHPSVHSEAHIYGIYDNDVSGQTVGVDSDGKLGAAPVGSGSYNPTWTTESGFTSDPATRDCEYSRVYTVVNVVCYFYDPEYSPGTNRAHITLPPGLNVASGSRYFVNGSFSSDTYRNATETQTGVVTHNNASTVVLMIKDSNYDGLATAYANFTYKTDAP